MSKILKALDVVSRVANSTIVKSIRSGLKMNGRPAWDEVWMQMAHLIAQRSYDPRYRVGVVVVTEDNTQVLAVGYNGNYTGGPNKVESEIPGESGMLHAEINALLKMDYNSPQKKIMYITLSPCRMCAKAIVNAGINRVIYNEVYRDTSSLEILHSSGVEASRFDREDDN